MTLLTSSVHAEGVLPVSQLKPYVDQFNADDRESFQGSFPNSQAWEFLSANIPLFECPDKEIEKTYYFRWWTFRKHLVETPDGWVITEFLPNVSWSGKYNTINCAAAHQIREGRWLKDQKFAKGYLDYWLTKGGRVHAYSFWVADSALAWCEVTGDQKQAVAWLPLLVKNYQSWEASNLDPVTGLFWQWDGIDGMEGSIGLHGFRPTINSYMYGDALAIARIAEMSGQPDLAVTYRAKAEKIKKLVQERLWNEEHQFFEIRRSPLGLGVARIWVNNDPALTQTAKVSASTPGKPDLLKDSRVPVKSSDLSLGAFQFDRRIGTKEWIQYDFPQETDISSCQFFLANAGIFVPPQSVKVFQLSEGGWKEIPQSPDGPQSKASPNAKPRPENGSSKGSPFLLSRWNVISFPTIRTRAIRLEFEMEGTDRQAAQLSQVRELIGYVPWCFNLPDSKYGVAWKQITDPKGFSAPYGLTTAEQRHPEFAVQYDRHECMWNGPIWPFATTQTLNALANYLNNEPQPTVTRKDYFEALRTYALSQRLKLEDGKVVPWVDEDQNPFTGDWIARTCILAWEKKDPKKWQIKGGTSDRGKDYNHSNFCDLVINGLVGLRPQADNTVVVNPLVPEGLWEYFCLDRVSYHGRMLTILWDKTGKHYGKGAGLRVLADDKEIASSPTLSKVTGKLSKQQSPKTKARTPEGNPPALTVSTCSSTLTPLFIHDVP